MPLLMTVSPIRWLLPLHEFPSAEVPLWKVVLPIVVLCWFQEEPVPALNPWTLVVLPKR